MIYINWKAVIVNALRRFARRLYTTERGRGIMLLQKYWSLLTKCCGYDTQVGRLWGTVAEIGDNNIWGYPSGTTEKNQSKAWQRHKIQPSRGFFSIHTSSDKSLYELAEIFSRLYKKHSEQLKLEIKQMAVELFDSDVADQLCLSHEEEVESFLKEINSIGESPIEIIALMTAIFWFVLSIRPKNKAMWQAWRDNPKHEIPCPESRILDILGYMYMHSSKFNIHPEDDWVLTLSTGLPDAIKPVVIGKPDDMMINYDIDRGFNEIPFMWEGLSTLYNTYQDLFKRHYVDRMRCAGYNSKIVGVLYSKYITSTMPEIRCKYYAIDYITHRTIEEVVKEVKSLHPEKKDLLSIDLIKASDEKYGWLRTSVGVNVIVEVPYDKKIILHKRGKSAEYGNKGKIYPSVVETIDLEADNRDFSLNVDPVTACAARGLEEELGLPSCFKNANSDCIYGAIKNVAYARTKDFNQDNFFSIVRLKDEITIKDVERYAIHAREHMQEVREIEVIPNDPYSIIKYMIEHKTEMINQTMFALWIYICDYQKRNNGDAV